MDRPAPDLLLPQLAGEGVASTTPLAVVLRTARRLIARGFPFPVHVFGYFRSSNRPGCHQSFGVQHVPLTSLVFRMIPVVERGHAGRWVNNRDQGRGR